jgi:hypothetical protein
MALSLFSKGFLQQIRLHARIRKHALQPRVLILQALHLADHGRIHAAILRALLVERRRAHAMLAAQISHRHTSLGLAQDRKDLGFVKSRHLHQILLSHLAEKILHPHPLKIWGDYRQTIQN